LSIHDIHPEASSGSCKQAARQPMSAKT
jgi:hypothetical protein